MRFRLHQKKRHTMVYTESPDDYPSVKARMFELAKQIFQETGKAVEVNVSRRPNGVEAFLKHPDVIGARLSDKNIADTREAMLAIADESQSQVTESDPRLSNDTINGLPAVIERFGVGAVRLPHPDLEYDSQQKMIRKKP